jgi:hypothetical protein
MAGVRSQIVQISNTFEFSEDRVDGLGILAGFDVVQDRLEIPLTALLHEIARVFRSVILLENPSVRRTVFPVLVMVAAIMIRLEVIFRPPMMTKVLLLTLVVETSASMVVASIVVPIVLMVMLVRLTSFVGIMVG